MFEAVLDVDPDILYMPGYYNVMDRLVLQARTAGLLQTILGSDGWDSPDLDLSVVDGSYFTTHYLTTDPRPEISLTQRYTSRYLIKPDAVAFELRSGEHPVHCDQELEPRLTVPVAAAMGTLTLKPFPAHYG